MSRMAYKAELRRKRALRRRKKCRGTESRPRLSIYRSLRHINGQLIDDDGNRTLCSLSSQSTEVQKKVKGKMTKTDIARLVGEQLGEKSKNLGIERVKCDIGPYRFHGRVKALVEGFQKNGISL